MANTSKHKFKEIKKKLKADIALSINQVLNKISKATGDKAKKHTNTSAGKVAKDFIKRLKKEEKAATKSVAKRKPAKKTTATSAVPRKKRVVKKRTVRKPVVKKEPAEIVETSVPVAETSHENIS